VEFVRKGELWGTPAALVAHTARMLMERGWSPPAKVLDQTSMASTFEAATGERWQRMPRERLLAC